MTAIFVKITREAESGAVQAHVVIGGVRRATGVVTNLEQQAYGDSEGLAVSRAWEQMRDRTEVRRA